MKTTFSLLSFFLVLSVALMSHSIETVDCKVRAKFSSEGSIAEVIVQEIRKARSTLFLALYGFNNEALADLLVEQAALGVTVRLKIDAEKSIRERQHRMIESLKAAGIQVQVVAPEERNHNKFAIIDETTVITGSYNWSLRAESNWENLLILDCPELAKKYAQEWKKIP